MNIMGQVHLESHIFPISMLLPLSCGFVTQNAYEDRELETENNYQAWIAFEGNSSSKIVL